MTQPTLPDGSAQARALTAALAEGLAQALQAPFVSLTTQLRQTNETYAELVAAVDRLTATVAVLAAGDQDPDDAPDIEMPLERFHNFDWREIGAQVLQEDEFGPAIVAYRGKAFKRRSPDNQYNPAIWFSRAVGKTEDGRNQYVRLITFKPMSDDVQPMGRKAERAVASAPPPAAPAAPKPPAAPNPPAGRPTAASVAPEAAASAPVTSAPPPAAPAGVVGAPAQPVLPDEPDWPARELTADQEFNSWPSASAGKPPLQPKQPPAGPRVSGGANAAGPAAPAAPALPPPGRRQATIGGGEVYGAFTKWGNDFARRYPHYRVAKTDRTDFYHIQVSLYSIGETGDHKDSRYAYIKELDLLNEAIAAMEQHAATHHSDAHHSDAHRPS